MTSNSLNLSNGDQMGGENEVVEQEANQTPKAGDGRGNHLSRVQFRVWLHSSWQPDHLGYIFFVEDLANSDNDAHIANGTSQLHKREGCFNDSFF